MSRTRRQFHIPDTWAYWLLVAMYAIPAAAVLVVTLLQRIQ